jgi:uncharacterized 2Fe-2S/4Fe-4S cluster protein (DUF4445 family)
MSADAIRWSCARCDVSVGRIDGEVTRLPDSWSRTEEEVYCLSCSRARAGEVAMDSAPASCTREERVRRRRKALIEFEIGRAPEAPNRTIALACRTSSAAVVAVRNELERATATAAPADFDARSVA